MAAGSLNFTLIWGYDSNPQTANLVSPSEFKDLMLYGIPLCNPTTGYTISDASINLQVKAARDLIERMFGIKIAKQITQETKDFIREEFYSFGYVRTTYPVNKAYRLIGQLNQQQIIFYPIEWLTCRTGNDMVAWRNLYIVPTGYGATTFIQGYYAYQTYFNFFGQRYIPDYWQLTYCTGFDVIPSDLLMLILKLAAIQVLIQLEMGIFNMGGYAFGLSSQSLSLDGLSQSVSKMNGGNIFSQRIKQYWDEFNQMMPMVKGNYSGINFEVL